MYNKTLGKFQWVSGSINDNVSRILRELNIEYHYNFNGDILADVYGIGYFQQVKHDRLNNNDIYGVYVD